MIVFSSKFIERFLQEHPWEALGRQTHDGNLKIEPYLQVEVYREFCERLGRPPTANEFWANYFQLNRIDIEKLSPEEKGGLQKRVHDKAWAAFICEDHFLGLLVESGEFDSIYRSTAQDTGKGIDFKIAKNDADYVVKTHFSFTKSIDDGWMTRKGRRKAALQLNIKIIDMPLVPEEAELVGNVCLYTQKHVSKLLELVKAQEINAEGKGKAEPASVPTPVPEAAAATSPQPGSEIEQLGLNWRRIIDEASLDIKRTPVIAILRSAGVKPVAIEGDTVVLAFRYPIHKEKMEQAENQQVAEKIISNFLGHPCHVRCIHEPENNHLLQEALKMGAQITSVEEK